MHDADAARIGSVINLTPPLMVIMKKQPLMHNEKTYQEIVGSAPLVLVVFHAHWCPHCRRMHSTVADAEELLDRRARVFRFDIDECGGYAEQAHVTSIPTFIAYSRGKPVWRYTGELSGDELLGKMEGIINHYAS